MPGYSGASKGVFWLASPCSPPGKIGELDNRGSHFCLARHCAHALTAQGNSAALQARFKGLAGTLSANEAKINAVGARDLAQLPG